MQTICSMAARGHVPNRCGLGVVFKRCFGACICIMASSLARRALPKPSRTSTHLSSSSPTVAWTSLRVLTRAKKIGLVKCVEPCLRCLRDAPKASLQHRSSPLASTASVPQALQAASTSQRVLDDKSLAVNCTCAVSCRRRAAYLRLSAASKQYIFIKG